MWRTQIKLCVALLCAIPILASLIALAWHKCGDVILNPCSLCRDERSQPASPGSGKPASPGTQQQVQQPPRQQPREPPPSPQQQKEHAE